MSIYRDGAAQPEPDLAVLAVLRSHQWDGRAKGCACGWTQQGVLPRGREQLNHPVHVASQLAASEPVRLSAAYGEQP